MYRMSGLALIECWVTLGKSVGLSEPWCFHPQPGEDGVCLPEWERGIRKMTKLETLDK